MLRESLRTCVLAAIVVSSAASAAFARDWMPFEKLPRADKVRAAQGKLMSAPRSARLRDVRWDLAAGQVFYRRGDEWFSMPLTGGDAKKLDAAPETAAEPNDEAPPRRPPAPARGRQAEKATTVDGNRVALYRDGNLYLQEGSTETAITTGGGGKVKYGSASWVYGEELDQTTAMWWSPDGKRLAFYRFDDSNVIDFPLPVGWTKLRTSLQHEAYPKPGEPNPIAALMIYDVASKATVEVNVGTDRDQYIYEVEWTPDSSRLLFRRTNRHQNTLDLVIADPTSGATRTVLTEKQPCWQKNSPEFRFLKDGKRFVWESERTGFAQFELWSLDGERLAEITHAPGQVDSIVRIDEARDEFWYVARSSETKINPQLHRARLTSGSSADDRRLTPDDLHWSGFRIAPDGSYFVATSEFVDVPASTHLFRADGTKVATLAQGDAEMWANAGSSKPEFLRLLAADGTTPIYGILWKPSDFDPSKKYPLLVQAYGGPAFNQISSRTSQGKADCEFGLLIMTIDNRGTPGRGKEFETANYLSLGEEDCDDQAAAVKQICERPYVDREHVAITGHSYGGFMTVIAMLRYPDVFQVGVAGAPPTDWRNYDTIYTERYMRTPQENAEGYDKFSCVKLAENLKGQLLLLHGMVDDNVHSANSWQLVDELQKKNRPFEMMFFPRSDHSISSPATEGVKWTFLLRHLGLLNPTVAEHESAR